MSVSRGVYRGRERQAVRHQQHSGPDRCYPFRQSSGFVDRWNANVAIMRGKAPTNRFCQGRPWGRFSVRHRALRRKRPGRQGALAEKHPMGES